LTVAQTILAT